MILTIHSCQTIASNDNMDRHVRSSWTNQLIWMYVWPSFQTWLSDSELESVLMSESHCCNVSITCDSREHWIIESTCVARKRTHTHDATDVKPVIRKTIRVSLQHFTTSATRASTKPATAPQRRATTPQSSEHSAQWKSTLTVRQG